MAVVMALVALLSSAFAQPARDTRLQLPSGTIVDLRRDTGDPSYSIRTGDGRRSGLRPADPMIRLRYACFDPLVAAPVAARLPESGRLRLIQFETCLLEDYTSTLDALGIKVHRIVPGQTVIAEVPLASLPRIAALDFVRWVGPFPAEARLDPWLLGELDATAAVRGRYVVQVMRRGLRDKTAVAREVRAVGGTVEPLTPDGFLLRTHLTPRQLMRIAALDEVLWVERAAAPRAAVDKVRQDSGVDLVEVRTGYTGAGVRGEVLDTGLALNHPDFQTAQPILHGPNTAQMVHGTAVYGVVFGTGTGMPSARGLLPEGQGIFATFTTLENRYRHTAALLQPPYRAVFQTNSWGNGPSPPGYPSLSFEMDDIIHQSDLLTCQAFGNSGSQVAFRQAWAKNVVTVGGIQHLDTLDPGDDRWNGRATIGPATDGRIKPDLCYWNDNIHTTRPPATYTPRFGGTSAATPQVAGIFGLFFQMWHEEVFGNAARRLDVDQDGVFDRRPHSSTARAFVYNTAEPYPFAGIAHDLTRTHQGWGRPDAERLHDLGRGVLVIDEWLPLRNFEVARYHVGIAAGQSRLRATLVYTDPPGTSAAALHRINDLSLRVISPDGTHYWGNAGLAAGNTSESGDLQNALDTVEQVWLNNPAPGRWIVEVWASEVALDAHLETARPDADFALVVAPVAPIVRDLGKGLPARGCAAPPRLEAHGSFVRGAPWRFDVSGATPGSECHLVIGERVLGQPFLQGVLVPEPERVLHMWVDDRGKATFAGTLDPDDDPRRRPSLGVHPARAHRGSFYVQAWMRDTLGPGGATASNAVEVIWPEVGR